jgi:multidrug efflux pump subunit AcrA (membrane-fusion protein)
MTPEEQIAELQAALATAQAVIDGEPARTADAVAAAHTQLAAYASGLEATLSAAQSDLAAAQQQLAVATADLAVLRPPAGSVITPVEFQRRLIPARFRLPYLSAEVRAGWEAVFREVLTAFSAIYLTDPLLGGMLAKAVADGVLSQAEADAVAAYSEV